MVGVEKDRLPTDWRTTHAIFPPHPFHPNPPTSPLSGSPLQKRVMTSRLRQSKLERSFSPSPHDFSRPHSSVQLPCTDFLPAEAVSATGRVQSECGEHLRRFERRILDATDLHGVSAVLQSIATEESNVNDSGRAFVTQSRSEGAIFFLETDGALLFSGLQIVSNKSIA